MKLNNYNGLEYYTFQSFTDTGLVKHMFSTRIGGVSEGYYKSLNLSFGRGDNKALVMKNLELASKAIGLDLNNIVMARQVHKTAIKEVTYENRGMGITKERFIEGYDGVMTNEAEVVLVTLHADCVPLYFLDTKNKAIALSHSGWRGTVDNIMGKTIEAMKNRYGTNTSNLLVGIGPSISKCCFEVSLDVYSEFSEKTPNSMDFIEESKADKDKFFIDLKGINKRLCILSGVPEENIYIASQCTKCLKDKFFSHRLLGDNRGSMAAFLALK